MPCYIFQLLSHHLSLSTAHAKAHLQSPNSAEKFLQVVEFQMNILPKLGNSTSQMRCTVVHYLLMKSQNISTVNKADDYEKLTFALSF